MKRAKNGPLRNTGNNDYHFRRSIYWEEKILTLCGLHPEKVSKIFSWKSLKPLLSLTMVIYLIISTTAAIYFYDFDRVVESIMLAVAVIRFFCKLLVFFYQRAYFHEIVEALEDPVFYSFTQMDLEHFRVESKKTKTLGLLHFSSAIIFSSCLAIRPFIFNRDFQLVLIWERLDMGHITFFCHLFGLIFAIFNHVSMDNIFRMMTTFACCQFDIIMNSFKMMDFKKFEESEVALRANIIRHIHVLRFIPEINGLVSYMALIQYLISILAICVALFQIAKNPLTSSTVFGNITFLLCMIIEIILYCWYGEAIKDKNDDLSRTLYLTNWYESPVKIRKMILIMGERCKKSIRLEVGGFTNMSLSSFLNIMRSAYSSFTVLRRINT